MLGEIGLAHKGHLLNNIFKPNWNFFDVDTVPNSVKQSESVLLLTAHHKALIVDASSLDNFEKPNTRSSDLLELFVRILTKSFIRQRTT